MNYTQAQQTVHSQGRGLWIAPEVRGVEGSIKMPSANLSRSEQIRSLYSQGFPVKQIQESLGLKYSSQIYSAIK